MPSGQNNLKIAVSQLKCQEPGPCPVHRPGFLSSSHLAPESWKCPAVPLVLSP